MELSEELFAGQDVRAYAERGDKHAGVVVVSFSQIAANVAGTAGEADDGRMVEQPFASKPLRALGVERIFVIACWRHGWQTPEMAPVIAAVNAHVAALGQPQVVVIGTSLGAFAALVFGSALHASGVFAMAPQATVDIQRLPWDPRSRMTGFIRILERFAAFRREDGKLPYDDMTATLRAPCRKYIVYDAHALDGLHAERIQGNNVSHHPVFHAGHQVSHYLRQTGVFQTMLSAVLTGDDEAFAACIPLARRRRRRSPVYREALAEALLQTSHPVLARRALKALALKYPRHLDVRMALIKLLRRQGKAGAAMVEAEAILKACPGDRQAEAMLELLREQRASPY